MVSLHNFHQLNSEQMLLSNLISCFPPSILASSFWRILSTEADPETIRLSKQRDVYPIGKITIFHTIYTRVLVVFRGGKSRFRRRECVIFSRFVYALPFIFFFFFVVVPQTKMLALEGVCVAGLMAQNISTASTRRQRTRRRRSEDTRPPS